MNIIVDNFFEDPHNIRNIALDILQKQHDCIINDAGDNYPGIRSKIPLDIFDLIKNFLNSQFDNRLKKLSAAFHVTSKIHKLGLVHTDAASHAGVIYLNENPPKHSGTILCNPIVDPDIIANNSNFKDSCLTHDINVIQKFVNYKEKLRYENFQVETEIENKFNRFITYSGKQYHAPNYYFGNNLFNSRLALVFLFYLI